MPMPPTKWQGAIPQYAIARTIIRDKYRRTKTKGSDMDITDIFTHAKERGLARSLRRFSVDFLGRAANYAADAGLDRCSADVLLNLYRRFGEFR